MKIEIEVKQLERGVKVILWRTEKQEMLAAAKGHTVIEALMMLGGNYKKRGTDLDLQISASGFKELPCDWQKVGGE